MIAVSAKYFSPIECDFQLECDGQWDRSALLLQRISSSLQTKDREIAKLKSLIFQKDNETLALSSSHKNALLQVGTSLAVHWHWSLRSLDGRSNGTRTESVDWTQRTAPHGWTSEIRRGESAFTERTAATIECGTRTVSTFREEIVRSANGESIERELHLNWFLSNFEQSSEAKLMLKESGRERINAVYGTKEQCRKEFQDEIVRLRHQFQLVRTDLLHSRLE